MMKSIKNKFAGIFAIAETLCSTDKILLENKSVCGDIIAIIKRRVCKLLE